MTVKELDLKKAPACTTQKSFSNYSWSEHPDEKKWADCTHCGMCLESCPTYELTVQEQHSPRGRVHHMKSGAEVRRVVSEHLMDPVLAWLDCRACTTACPADVGVGCIIEEDRDQLRQANALTGLKNTLTEIVLQGMFAHQNR